MGFLAEITGALQGKGDQVSGAIDPSGHDVHRRALAG
jgi:hypothetical protein